VTYIPGAASRKIREKSPDHKGRGHPLRVVTLVSTSTSAQQSGQIVAWNARGNACRFRYEVRIPVRRGRLRAELTNQFNLAHLIGESSCARCRKDSAR
jgi:hypothetical protein